MFTEKIEDAIMVYHNLIDSNFCDRCVEYMDKLCSKPLSTRVGDTDYRQVLGHTLTKKTISEQIYFKKIYDEIFHFYSTYKMRFPRLQAAEINQIDLLKYSAGGKYLYHTDDFHGSPRSLSVIINLNDDYEGGNLIFTDQQDKEIKEYKLGKGSIVFFPSNFLYPHSITPITKGKRYSIVAWLQ